jgi:bud site selection protein 31
VAATFLLGQRKNIMPLPQRWNKSKKRPPPNGFDYVEPILEALENELRDKVKETDPKQRKLEVVWPIHQINWQKTRYVYDLYHVHHRITKSVYQYCIDQNLIDAALIAKWKKPGYERLCSTYVINPTNYKFGTTSICRVPLYDRSESTKYAQDPTVCTLLVVFILIYFSVLFILHVVSRQGLRLTPCFCLELFLFTLCVLASWCGFVATFPKNIDRRDVWVVLLVKVQVQKIYLEINMVNI